MEQRGTEIPAKTVAESRSVVARRDKPGERVSRALDVTEEILSGVVAVRRRGCDGRQMTTPEKEVD